MVLRFPSASVTDTPAIAADESSALVCATGTALTGGRLLTPKSMVSKSCLMAEFVAVATISALGLSAAPAVVYGAVPKTAFVSVTRTM